MILVILGDVDVLWTQVLCNNCFNCKIRRISAFQSFVGTQKRAHQDMLVMSGFTHFINFGWLLRI